MATTINLTPTWGDIGLLAYRLAVSNEEKALAHLRPDFARAFAMAEALTKLMPTLSDDQQGIASRVLVAELTKQGY